MKQLEQRRKINDQRRRPEVVVDVEIEREEGAVRPPAGGGDRMRIEREHHFVVHQVDVLLVRLPVGGGKPKIVVKNASYPAWSK